MTVKLKLIWPVLSILSLCFLFWALKILLSNANPFIANFLQVCTIPLVIIVSVILTKWILNYFGMATSNRTVSLFTLASLGLLVASSLFGIFMGNSAVDIQMHDTYFVVAHFHLLFAVGILFGFFALIYFLFPKISGRLIKETLGKLHFWISLIGIFIVLNPLLYLSISAVPRRYYSFEGMDAYRNFEVLNSIITISAIVVFIAQLLFLTNIIYSLIKGPRTSK